MDIEEWVESVKPNGVEESNGVVEVEVPKEPVNLMSDYNKKFLKENLVRQLMKDCPPTRDYYYMTVKIRNETNQAKAKELLGQLYPKYRFGNGLNEDDPVDNGDVGRITNALGHVKIATRTAPRKLLDPEIIERVQEKIHNGSSKGGSADREVLYKIEGLYQALLVFEETMTRTLILEYSSGFDRRAREDAEEFTVSVLQNEALLKRILIKEKGMNVVCRWMKHLKPARIPAVFATILCQLKNVVLDERRTEKAYHSLLFFTSELSEEQYLEVIQDLPAEELPALMKTRLGISLVILLLTRGSVFCRRANLLNSPLMDEFGAFFRAVTEVFSDEDVSSPLEFYTCFLDNMYLENSTYGGEEYREYWKYLHDDYFVEAGCKIVEKPVV